MAVIFKTLAVALLLLSQPGVASSTVQRRQPILVGDPADITEGWYTRGTYVNDGVLLGCFTADADDEKSIRVARSDDNGATWDASWGTVLTTGPSTLKGLDNCFLHQLPDRGSILAAFRDHTKKTADEGYVQHSLVVYASDDGGRTFEPRGVVAENDVTGHGIYEPFLLDGGGAEDTMEAGLQLYYSLETRTDGLDQNNIMVRSYDGGKTWSTEEPTVVSGGDRQVRDGMTGVVRLASGKLLVVFESLLPNTGITLMSSTDDGKTWGNRRPIVHEPSNAPYIAKVGSTLVVTFMGQENPGQRDVHLLISTDSGATWGDKTDVCQRCELAGQVVVDDDTFLVLANTDSTYDTRVARAYRMSLA